MILICFNSIFRYEANRANRGEEAQNQILKIVLAGSDSLVNHVVRLFVEQLSKKSRAWCMDKMRFYLIPFGKQIYF
jgi:hypothetical protein